MVKGPYASSPNQRPLAENKSMPPLLTQRELKETGAREVSVYGSESWPWSEELYFHPSHQQPLGHCVPSSQPAPTLHCSLSAWTTGGRGEQKQLTQKQ